MLRDNTITTKQAGDAFEVFAESFLRLDPLIAAVDVWPHGTVPAEILQQLNISTKDLGCDGVYRDVNGHLNTYQAKFRTGRKSLGYGELATFLAASDQADGRLIVTNATSISEDVRDRRNVMSVTGPEFDRVLEDRMDGVFALIQDKDVVREVASPREHQAEAVENAVEALRQSERTQVIMACGSGKTLVGLWVAERLGASTIIFFAPSLALIRQSLTEWSQNHSWGKRFRYLCVCSDQTVAQDADADEVRDRQADFRVRVTTSACEVASYIDGHSADHVSVIFATYQSAEVLEQALPSDFQFEFGIFDEAHKTVGAVSNEFATAVCDTSVAIGSRLFMTATPRTIKSKRPGSVCSMDDPAWYGEVAYRLSFREAISRGIICPYKVIISVVTDDDLGDLTENSLSTHVETGSSRNRSLVDVAAQVALARAVEAYGIKKAFTFHATVKDAATFETVVAKHEAGMLSGFEAFHVTGAMNAGERGRRINEFRDRGRAVMSNARCLTEGVDVPAVDLVAFMNRKKSKVDIVQAIGRALRKSEGKECGYILLPLLMRFKDETPDMAANREGYKDVWEVLKALMEQDEMLVEATKLALLEGVHGGQKGAFLDGLVEVLAPGLDLNQVLKAVEVRIVDGMGSLMPQLKPKKEKLGMSEKAKLAIAGRSRVSDSLEKQFGCTFSKRTTKGRQYADDGTVFHIAHCDYYKETDAAFVKVAPRHFDANWFVLWRLQRTDGWIIPTSVLREFLEQIPKSKRKGDPTWDPRIRTSPERDLMSTHFDRYPALDITRYRADFTT